MPYIKGFAIEYHPILAVIANQFNAHFARLAAGIWRRAELRGTSAAGSYESGGFFGYMQYNYVSLYAICSPLAAAHTCSAASVNTLMQKTAIFVEVPLFQRSVYHCIIPAVYAERCIPEAGAISAVTQKS